MILSLPCHVIEAIGGLLDHPSRRSCLLAHKSLAPTMFARTFHTWTLRDGQPFDKKFASLLKLQPRLTSLAVVVREEFDVERFVDALDRGLPPSVELIINCEECDGAIKTLLQALSSIRPNRVELFGELQRFTTFLEVMDHCSAGWLSVVGLSVMNYFHVDVEGNVERIRRLTRSWHERPWTVVNVLEIYSWELDDVFVGASPIQDLLKRCVRRLFVSCQMPTALSRVAQHLECRWILAYNNIEFMEDLANNPNLRVLIVREWISKVVVVNQKALFDRATKHGQVTLRLCDGALKDPSLGNVLLATSCKVELMVTDALGAFVAWRTVESLKSRLPPDRVTIKYVTDEARSTVGLSLADLAARIAGEQAPAVCAYFDVMHFCESAQNLSPALL